MPRTKHLKITITRGATVAHETRSMRDRLTPLEEQVIGGVDELALAQALTSCSLQWVSVALKWMNSLEGMVELLLVD